MKTFKRLLRVVVAIVAMLVLVASPVLAMLGPDAIAFYCIGSVPVYRVFYNVKEANDMLFVAEQYVHYGVAQNITAGEAFLFEVLNASGNVTIASTPLKAYEAKPISIYQTAAQVSGNLTIGGNYTLRITGNPLIFPPTANNTVSVVLDSGKYVNQLLGQDNGVATNNNLRNFIINNVAKDIETHDKITVPATNYIDLISGVNYLTTTGGDIFLEGIPGLDAMCPILFKSSTAPMTGDEPESTGAYASSLSPLAKWGSTAADGLTNLGIYLGINQALAGSVMLFALAVALAIYVFLRTQSGIATLLLVATTPFLGVWLGLMPMALAFSFVIIIVVLMGFFFFSRGIL